MNPETLNAINAGTVMVWQFLLWACTLLAGLFSGGFIIACLGGALWQLALEAWRGMRWPSASLPGRRTQRAVRIALIGGCLATAALAQSQTTTVPQQTCVVSVSSSLLRGNTWLANGHYAHAREDFSQMNLFFARMAGSHQPLRMRK